MQTGFTKPKRGTTLSAQKETSASGEDVVLLLQVDGAPNEAKTLEKECATVMKHALLETEGNAAERLDSTLKELNGLFKGLAFAQATYEVHAIVGIIDKAGVLHVSHAGRAEAYVVRAGTASQITEYTRGKPTPAFVHIASGALEPRDVIIFSTQRLLRTVTPAQLAQLAQRDEHLLDELVIELEAEREQSAIGVLHVSGRGGVAVAGKQSRSATPVRLPARKTGQRRGDNAIVSSLLSGATAAASRAGDMLQAANLRRAKSWFTGFTKDLRDPKRKRRAHLLLLAFTVAVFLVVWAFVNLTTTSQKRQSRTQLQTQLEEVDQLISTAENRRISGETESANTILEQAEQQAKQVMDNESNLFRAEALDLLERIRVKREEINNIVRITPRPIANLATKNDAIDAQGFIGLADAEFLVYDRQDLYRVLLNTVEDPTRLTDDELILEGDNFPRYQTEVFQLTDNSIVELVNNQPTIMKTEDPAGWIKGAAMRTYLRFLYMLSPENNQIYKYERLSNRYTAPAEYNVNGDLSGGLDIAIDGSVYVLKQGGEVLKLLRGEVQPFTIRHLPEGALAGATKIYKVFDGHLYFLDPENSRVIVTTDGGATGEGAYVQQYILEGDQLGELRDIYIDEEETQLYILSDKKVLAIDLR